MKDIVWQDFLIKDLFDIILSKDDLQPQKLINGIYPLVSSGKTNNGICMYIEKQNNATLYKGGIITVDMFGKAFYQEKDFYCVSHGRVNILKPKFNINKHIGLFFTTVITRTMKDKYSFKKMCSSRAIANEYIKLPVRKNCDIDFDYIENKIATEENMIKTRYNDLKSIGNLQNNIIDTSKWEEFKIGELFPKIVSSKVYHTKDVEEAKDGIPYIVRTKFNNGLKYRVKNNDDFVLNPANVISFGAENATFFFQPEEYISGRDMYYIDTQGLSKNSILFIISCLQKITDKYSYSYGLFPGLLKEEKIKLPTKDNGVPDWEFMDKFIENQKYIK